ncbi:hypothetical protein N7532_000764 [Penicillium argentinense]|uniref:Uncharacterized protein n=1 Tax=Penicillium argentinense TaxID=1131581 RepID=A0A9W9G5T8_9EURO|nr:uncharacterized protein N7532_000764 [Penicillium argentinense]KAJ5112719.1 hypothetical protein N7532_000764 [Penicillium argentinense]
MPNRFPVGCSWPTFPYRRTGCSTAGRDTENRADQLWSNADGLYAVRAAASHVEAAEQVAPEGAAPRAVDARNWRLDSTLPVQAMTEGRRRCRPNVGYRIGRPGRLRGIRFGLENVRIEMMHNRRIATPSSLPERMQPRIYSTDPNRSGNTISEILGNVWCPTM